MEEKPVELPKGADPVGVTKNIRTTKELEFMRDVFKTFTPYKVIDNEEQETQEN